MVLSSLVNFEPKRVKEARARAPRKRDFGLLLKIWPNMAFLAGLPYGKYEILTFCSVGLKSAFLGVLT